MKNSAMSGIVTVLLLLSLFLPAIICSNVTSSSMEVPPHTQIVLPKVLTKLLTVPSESTPLFMEGQHNPSTNKISVPPKEKVTPEAAVESVTSSVHARKGVDLLPEDNHAVNSTISTNKNVTSKITPVNKTIDLKAANDTKVSTTTKATVELVPKKPTVTIARDEENLMKKEHVKPSTTTTKIIKEQKQTEAKETAEESNIPVHDYVNNPKGPSTVDDKNYNFFTYIRNVPSNQPGFIVPVIITIFAVPFMALLGYQAVRRGREAWRNRHYSRMDFLIDGMYND